MCKSKFSIYKNNIINNSLEAFLDRQEILFQSYMKNVYKAVNFAKLLCINYKLEYG